MNFAAIFPLAFSYFKRDKLLILLSLAPLFLGILLYGLIGTWIFSELIPILNEFMASYVSEGALGNVLYYLIIGVTAVLGFFLINWTFVLLVGVLASPFNDFISTRVEKLYLGEELPGFLEGVGNVFSRIVKIVFNEIKKIGVIIFFTILSVILSFIPFLVPISIFITAILMATSFLDYTWARKDMPSSECFKDIRKGLWPYSLSGFIFMGLMSVPALNLLALPYGVIYYTILHLSRKDDSISSNKLQSSKKIDSGIS